MPDYLITTIPQTDGIVRKLYAPTKDAARKAKATLAADPAMVDHLGRSVVTGIVDHHPDGTTERVR